MLVLAHLVSSPRAWVLFYDGDSLLFPLVHASLAAGQPQQWVLSSPLFLPEAVVYLGVAATGLPVKAALLIDGVLNWVALYAAIRFLATLLRVRRSTAVGYSVLAVGLFTAVAICESSSSHDALELASLTATTTYYSSTVVATVLATTLLIKALLRPSVRTLLPLAALIAFAVFSNPLFIAWSILPLPLLAVLALTCGTRLRVAVALIAVALGSTGIGLLARVPLSDLLVQDNAAKIRPDLALQSASYYAQLLQERLSSPTGITETALLLALLCLAGVMTLRAVRQQWLVGALIAGTAMITPLVVTVTTVALGTFAARYLQPTAFAPALAVLVVPLLRRRLARPAASQPGSLRPLLLRAGSSALLLTLVASSAAVLVPAAEAAAPGTRCIDTWLTAHPHATGAGQYWTIRSVRAYTAHSADRLLQTDSTGAGYAWLSNDADFHDRTYTFTITDQNSAPFTGRLDAAPSHSTHCGSYTIHDYAPAAFRLGAPHH